jgi:hypothetical protein
LSVVMRLCGSRDPDGDDLRFEYDFGDGGSGGGSCESDSHTYSGEGSWTATACVSDRQPGADHKKCCSFQVRAAFPTPTCDTIAPSVAITEPTNGSSTGSSSVTVKATASDNGSVASVTFFATPASPPPLQASRSAGRRGARQSPPGPITIGTDTTAPYEVVWDNGCPYGSFDLTAEAVDNCGNKTTSKAVNIFISCGGELPGETQSLRSIQWSSQLEAAGSAGRVSLNGSLLASGPGKQQGAARAKRDDNRVDGEVVQGGSRAGLWRFELSEGVAPGSVRVLAGDALEVSDSAVVFRIGGTTGERVSFVFRPRE